MANTNVLQQKACYILLTSSAEASRPPPIGPRGSLRMASTCLASWCVLLDQCEVAMRAAAFCSARAAVLAGCVSYHDHDSDFKGPLCPGNGVHACRNFAQMGWAIVKFCQSVPTSADVPNFP
eukprot:scaffold131557_cov23-Tisochrysis_lutea.AAC.1